MTQGASLDLERVEVLKGPQGTLFGQNSTGGAINYIAAKPTSTFQAGADVTYERFGRFDTSAFVSGPLSDTLAARLAVRAVEGGAWQKSLTRPADRLGAARQLQGRLLLDWRPTDRLKFLLSPEGWKDGSDLQAWQLTKVQPFNPALAVPGLLNGIIAGDHAREADWTAGWPNRAYNNFYQVSLRSEYALTDEITLTALTAYQHEKIDKYTEDDGLLIVEADHRQTGKIKDFSQEIRLSGHSGRVNWVIGGNYFHAMVTDAIYFHFDDITINQPIPSLPKFTDVLSTLATRHNSYAGFVNVEYKLSDSLTALGGVRYTDAHSIAGKIMTCQGRVRDDTGRFHRAISITRSPTLPTCARRSTRFDVAPGKPARWRSPH